MKIPKHPVHRTACGLIAVILSCAGCASHPLPAGQLVASEAAIAGALDAGAADRAPRELQSAQEKMELTKRWIAAKDYRPARWLAEQAQVDAELATMKARQAGF